MYYVNQEQISVRLAVIPSLVAAIEQLQKEWSGAPLQVLAQERVLHLAIEIVTDVGSYLIDGFIMRDASSYEDIIEINAGEGVFTEPVKQILIELVKLRRPLVQDYFEQKSNEKHPLLNDLATCLTQFSHDVEQFIQKELA